MDEVRITKDNVGEEFYTLRLEVFEEGDLMAMTERDFKVDRGILSATKEVIETLLGLD